MNVQVYRIRAEDECSKFTVSVVKPFFTKSLHMIRTATLCLSCNAGAYDVTSCHKFLVRQLAVRFVPLKSSHHCTQTHLPSTISITLNIQSSFLFVSKVTYNSAYSTFKYKVMNKNIRFIFWSVSTEYIYSKMRRLVTE